MEDTAARTAAAEAIALVAGVYKAVPPLALGLFGVLHELFDAGHLDRMAIERVCAFILSALPDRDEGHPAGQEIRESLLDRIEELQAKARAAPSE